ncbi:hypothetical protein AB2869_23445, partial [Escherichia coli]
MSHHSPAFAGVGNTQQVSVGQICENTAMPRFVYTLLMTVVAVLLPLKLFWRGLKQPEYRQHV